MLIPEKLKKGDEIRIVSPAQSMAIVSDDNIKLAKKKLESYGFKITFSKNCREEDLLHSSSIQSRVDDLHEAFTDKNVKAILTSIGGFNSNQLLSSLDFNLIKNNLKILCGYSDITVLANAITTKTGLVTYSGPHFSTFAMQQESEYNEKYFKKCLMEERGFILESSETWSDDLWFVDQDKRDLKKNKGLQILNEGEAEGKIIGGNLCSFNLLSGTEFMPDLTGAVVFLEDDDMVGEDFAREFDRNLQSLIQQRSFNKVRGIIFGRFQVSSKMNLEKIKYIINTKKELRDIPIVIDANFGHTNPIFTFPIGGIVKVMAQKGNVELKILKH